MHDSSNLTICHIGKWCQNLKIPEFAGAIFHAQLPGSCMAIVKFKGFQLGSTPGTPFVIH